MQSWSPLMFVFSAFVVMAILERVADLMHERRIAAQSQADAIFRRWHMLASINSTYGKCASYPIAKDNTKGKPCGSNRGTNTQEPKMPRHQFDTIQAARAFYSKARTNRMTRHGYYACADSLKACLVRHERFYIGESVL